MCDRTVKKILELLEMKHLTLLKPRILKTKLLWLLLVDLKEIVLVPNPKTLSSTRYPSKISWCPI